MRLFAWLACTGVAFSAAAVACTYPSFHFRGEGGGAGVGGMPNGGNGAGAIGGGVGGTTPTGTGGGGIGGGGGTGGGEPPTPCTAYSTGECEAGKKCSVYDVGAGLWGCVEAGPRPAWAHCQQDVECQEGTWCDLDSSVCKPICENSNICPDGGNCHPAAGNGGDIPGLQICTAYCDPMEAQSCNQGYGTTNCIVTDTILFDCYSSGSTGAYSGCGDPFDCGPELGCYTYLLITLCREWCYVANDTCPPLTSCQAFTPTLTYDGDEYGVCG